jgi:exonuclease VII small subunit
VSGAFGLVWSSDSETAPYAASSVTYMRVTATTARTTAPMRRHVLIIFSTLVNAAGPLDWAMTQNNLGNALRVLGERESGTARLEEAVAAYRDALQEYTRERAPLQWATTQMNLGTALSTLGERDSACSVTAFLMPAASAVS